MQIEKVLKLEGVDLLLFLGINDSNLKLIEKKFNTNLTVRGDNIYLKGEVEEVNIVEHIFKEMIYVLNTTGRLRISDIETIMDLSVEERPSVIHDYDNIVLYTKKDVIRAKTPTQVEYYQKVTENDICFAIGPAGTGKTYLAVAFAISALKKGIVKRIVLARPAVEAGEI